jgi:toxin ParE1/3/4
MARKVKWTESAWNDIEEVFDYIAKDSSFKASSFIQEVRDSANSLDYLAERGRMVPEFNDSTFRELFIRKYRLIYQIKDETVFIVAFIHGSRDLLSAWKQGKRSSPENID